MKVSISYYPRDECMLATALDETISRLLSAAQREEIEHPESGMRNILFFVKPQSEEGFEAIRKEKCRLQKRREWEVKSNDLTSR